MACGSSEPCTPVHAHPAGEAAMERAEICVCGHPQSDHRTYGAMPREQIQTPRSLIACCALDRLAVGCTHRPPRNLHRTAGKHSDWALPKIRVPSWGGEKPAAYSTSQNTFGA